MEGEVAPEEQDFCRWMGDRKGIPGRGKSQVRDVGRNTWDCERFNRWGVEGGEAGEAGLRLDDEKPCPLRRVDAPGRASTWPASLPTVSLLPELVPGQGRHPGTIP